MPALLVGPMRVEGIVRPGLGRSLHQASIEIVLDQLPLFLVSVLYTLSKRKIGSPLASSSSSWAKSSTTLTVSGNPGPPN